VGLAAEMLERQIKRAGRGDFVAGRKGLERAEQDPATLRSGSRLDVGIVVDEVGVILILVVWGIVVADRPSLAVTAV
jgi:hypothetical protein